MNCLKWSVLSLLAILFFINTSPAQSEKSDPAQTVLVKDESFWIGYNACDYGRMGEYVADDVEFYHDKGGITLGKINLIDSIRKNLCGNPNFRTRREAVAGTVKAYLLKNSETIYGAIIEGDHYFYNAYDGKPEKREGLAKFTTLWLLRNGEWKMERILSYDHREAPYVNARTTTPLNKKNLKRFAGEYMGMQSGAIKVDVENKYLTLSIGKNKYLLHPQTANLFFVTERDLTFEFVSRKGEQIRKIVIREKGEIVEEAKSSKAKL